MAEINTNVILCSTWVPHGKARANPEKVEITVDELKDIMGQNESMINDMEITGDNSDEDEPQNSNEEMSEPMITDTEDKEVDQSNDLKEEVDIEKLYSLKDYDDEPDDTIGQLTQLGKLAVYADPNDDPLLVTPVRDDDEESEADNHAILPDDNLIAVGHYENGESILEVYVYNESTNALYVHHDNILPEAPLCMEWLSFNPAADDEKGNLVAVGIMGSVIQIWDLDLIDGLKPAIQLDCEDIPRVKNKLKRMKKQKKTGKVTEDEFGVLSLAWNKKHVQYMASGDTDGVIIWNLSKQQFIKSIDDLEGRVQSLKWHPYQANILLIGTTRGGNSLGSVYMLEYQQNGNVLNINDCGTKSWNVKGDVETVLWAPVATETCYILVSTSIVIHKKKNLKEGHIYCFEPNKSEALWTFQPHSSACSGLVLSTLCPGLLVTGSDDHTLKVWDTLWSDTTSLASLPLQRVPKLVEELNPHVGQVFTLVASPDQPFVFSMGGDNKSNNFRLWNIKTSEQVRRVFFPRLGLSVDESQTNQVRLEILPTNSEEIEELFPSNQSMSSNTRQCNTSHKKKEKRKVKRLVE